MHRCMAVLLEIAMRKIETVLNSVLELQDDELQQFDMAGVWALIDALPPHLRHDFINRFQKRTISFRPKYN